MFRILCDPQRNGSCLVGRAMYLDQADRIGVQLESLMLKGGESPLLRDRCAGSLRHAENMYALSRDVS